MKKVLFIGVTRYNLDKPEIQAHLKKKFEGLAQGIEPYVLAKGKPFHQRMWGADFYLLPSFVFWAVAPKLAFWLCLLKKIDIIITQGPLLEGLLGTVLKLVFRKQLIVEVHGDWEARRPALKIIWNFLAKISLKAADKIRAISVSTLKKAQSVCPNKPYFVFPTFTDVDDFLQEKETEFNNFILFVGNLQKIKGINILIDAFAQINQDFPDFKLVLIGDGPEKENLRLQISNLKIDDKVEFKGKLSLSETKEIMKKSWCLVLPSFSEGLGRVLIEAMALGKPVIGSRIGGIPDLIQDGQSGFLFEAGKVSELAEKLRTLLQNKEMAAEMGRRGREFVKSRFSNERYVADYLKMINS